jgi:hypothetical protein
MILSDQQTEGLMTLALGLVGAALGIALLCLIASEIDRGDDGGPGRLRPLLPEGPLGRGALDAPAPRLEPEARVSIARRRPVAIEAEPAREESDD